MTMRLRPLTVSVRHLLLGGVAMMLCAPMPALADDAPQTAQATPSSTTPPASADTSKAKQLGDITVTAQSRSQEMEQVPIALQIVTAKQIQTLAATDLSKMDIFVPGLTINAEQPTQPTYEIRGIATSDFGIGTESAVGVYVDGVYAARSGGALLAFNDVQRVEILKGPQGTLFGRNAAAGAISIVTNEPTDKFEGNATVRFGNYGERYENALVNIPLNNDMALRISVLDNQSDGWVQDASTGKHYGKNDDWGTRAVYRWNITPDTQVKLSWDHEKLNQPPEPAFGLIPLSNNTNQAAPFPANPATYLNPLHAPLYNDTVDAGESRRFDGVTLIVDHSFAWGGFTSTTAWRNFDTYNRGDYDGTNHIADYLDTANIEHNNSWYQEFKLNGNTDLIDWVGGVSWYMEQARQTSQTNVYTNTIDSLALNTGQPYTNTYGYFNSLLQGAGLPYTVLGDPWMEEIQNDQNYKAYAAFGDVIWHLSDQLDLTTGVRFTRDEKDFTWFNPPRYAPQLDATVTALTPLLEAIGVDPAQFRQNVIFNAASGDPVGIPVTFHNTWNNTSPRAVLNYKFTPDIMGYASITRGYKAGGYDSVQIGSRFAPETVTNFEAGIKSLFPDQNLMFNASAYYYRYNNKQSLTLDPNTTGSGVPFYTVSNSNQEAKGLEMELQWQPLSSLQVSVNTAYIDATYRHYIASDGVNLDGQATGEPLWSASANLAYTWRDVLNGTVVFNLSQGYRGRERCNADAVYEGQCEVSPNFSVGTSQKRTDARLDWNAPGDRWGVGIFASNLFNNRYVTSVDNITTTALGTPFASITPPRMYGVEMRVKF